MSPNLKQKPRKVTVPRNPPSSFISLFKWFDENDLYALTSHTDMKVFYFM